MQSILRNYQVILESIEEGVFTVNQEWRIMSFNRAAETITGISRKDAIGKYCHDVFRTNVCGEECVLRETLISGKSQSNVPVYFTRADNKRIPVSIDIAALRSSNGKMIGGVEIFRDLTVINELQKAYKKQYSFDDIVSKNERMVKYFSILPMISESDSIILIEGSTGTGKELMARAIHNNSMKKNGPFVAVNCGALPDTLIESELFGYKAGAFTDAKKDKPGRFALAHNGTIFLDEIGDISPAVQIRLLRVLQEKVYEPLGSNEPVHTNARVIAATNQNLEKGVKLKKFRKDLYYRINVIRLSLPNLSERREDIPLLADRFINSFNHRTGKKIIGVTHEVMTAFMLHEWPGNIRELENVLEHAFVLCQGDLIMVQHLPEHFQPRVLSTTDITPGLTLKEIEKHAITIALRRHGWKKMATARELGIDKNTLRRKIHRLDIIK